VVEEALATVHVIALAAQATQLGVVPDNKPYPDWHEVIVTLALTVFPQLATLGPHWKQETVALET